MSGAAPLTKTVESRVPARTATADGQVPIGEAPFAGTVTAVTYTADAALSGANTDTRTISVINKGQSGSGTTSVAALALVSGVNLAANDEKAITLSGTAANLVVAAGDILAFDSTHAGTNGLLDPGGLVQVDISRTAGS